MKERVKYYGYGVRFIPKSCNWKGNKIVLVKHFIVLSYDNTFILSDKLNEATTPILNPVNSFDFYYLNKCNPKQMKEYLNTNYNNVITLLYDKRYNQFIFWSKNPTKYTIGKDIFPASILKLVEIANKLLSKEVENERENL